MNQINLTWENMGTYLNVPLGYRFIDKVQLVSDREAWGTKMVSSQDWYFRIHFPGNPVMPGVFIMESVEQTALAMLAYGGRSCCFQACESMRLFSSVRPGDVLQSHVVIDVAELSRVQCRGETYIRQADGTKQKICTMRFTLVDAEAGALAAPDGILADRVMPNISSQAIAINFDDFDRYIADPLEYRFLDCVRAVPHKVAWGEKNVSAQEWYFPLCCIEHIAVPTAFVIETIMQTGVLAVTTIDPGRFKLMMYNSCSRLQVYGQAVPGTCIRTYAELKSFRNGIANFQGTAFCDDKVLCTMAFILVAPSEMQQVKR